MSITLRLGIILFCAAFWIGAALVAPLFAGLFLADDKHHLHIVFDK